MSKLYPPKIEGVIPAFTNYELSIPYSMNGAVSRGEVYGMALKIKTVQSNIPLGRVYEAIELTNDKAVFDVLPRAQAHLGSKVDFPRNNVEKCGNVISVSHNPQIAVQAAEDAVSNIFITLKPNTKETDDFLLEKTNDDEKGFPPSAFPEIPQNLLENLSDTINENQKISECIPAVFQEQKYRQMKDWSFNTLEQIAQKFDILRRNHPAFDARKFWQSVLRGGLQAAVYFSDSTK